MSTVPTAVATRPGPPQGPAAAPPPDVFWRNYSPYFELPVSATSSVLGHALILLLALLIAFGLVAIGPGEPKVVGVGTVNVADSMGAGDSESGGGSDAGPKVEKVEGPKDPATPKPAELDVSEPNVRPEEIAFEIPTPATNFDPEAVARSASESLRNSVASAQQKSAANPGNGKPGEGDGGTGSGKGGKDGDGSGVGKAAERAAAAARMQLTFNTLDGNDYLRQLAGLGAILAVQGKDGSWIVFRDLNRRPMRGKAEDVGKINRIYWVDSNPATVGQLAAIMGFRQPPSAVVAFFPEGLEEDLKRKEAAYTSGQGLTLDKVETTKFQVRFAGGRYTPEIVSQTLK